MFRNLTKNFDSPLTPHVLIQMDANSFCRRVPESSDEKEIKSGMSWKSGIMQITVAVVGISQEFR